MNFIEFIVQINQGEGLRKELFNKMDDAFPGSENKLEGFKYERFCASKIRWLFKWTNPVLF